MTKKQIFILMGCMVAGISFLGLLFAMSPIGAGIPRHPFTRIFPNEVSLEKEQEIDIKFNSFYFSGASNDTLYLGNWTAPLHLLRATLPKLDTQHIILNGQGITMRGDYQTFRLKVDPPNFYLVHGVIPAIYKGDLKTLKSKKFLTGDVPHFIEATPIDNKSMALRSLSIESKAYELAHLTSSTSTKFEFKPDLLEKQVDGIFCEEGTLHYSKTLNKLIYVYSYRNEFFTTDTSLNLIDRFHTIDTFKTAAIKVAHVDSKGYSTLASPPANINLQSSVSGKYLFIQSPLLSKNEDKVKFQTASVIDTYDINNGKYLFSFYIQDKNKKSLSSFRVFGNHLAVIYQNHLVLYKLNLPSDPIALKNQSHYLR